MLMMYLKENDNRILQFVEDNKSISIQICANLFFNNCSKESAYISASRRLKTLYDNKFLKRFRKTINDEYVYYRDGSPLGYHSMKLLEVYSKLSTIGEIVRFEKEFMVGSGKTKRKNDGLIEIKVEQGEYINTYAVIIEIDYSHETNWAKIRDIIKSGVYQKMYGTMPTILIVKRYEHMKKLNSNSDVEILNINWKLDGIEQLFE